MSLKGNPENMYYIFVSDSLAKAINNDIETDTTPKVLKKKFAMDFTKNIKEFSSENVAAFLKGTEHPDEVIVVSAHLDHEGVKNGEVYNGADDDGSGTVAVLQIADAFKQAAKDG
ncbi:MAG: M28 family peptidase, partial [Flavobacteriaceae bacterium]|nr:M28 family peptidase [Flavobacteriaceae bacterium]